MGQSALIDTNCASDYLKNRLSDNANSVIDGLTVVLSVVNRIELQVWPGLTPEEIVGL